MAYGEYVFVIGGRERDKFCDFRSFDIFAM